MNMILMITTHGINEEHTWDLLRRKFSKETKLPMDKVTEDVDNTLEVWDM